MGRISRHIVQRRRHVPFATAWLVALLSGACGTSGSVPSPDHSSGGKGAAGAPGTSGPGSNCGFTYDSCADDKGCCSGRCTSGRCSCVGIGSKCRSDAECCEDFACNDGQCTPLGCRADGASCKSLSLKCCSGACVGGTCGPPRCKAASEGCLENGECCDQLSCDLTVGPHGTCVPGCAIKNEPCGAEGQPSACCSGSECLFGRCFEVCQGIDLTCKSDNECCEGLACMNGHCRPCANPGSTCASAVDCCAGSCIGGKCSSCAPSASACSIDADCCARLHCSQGVCTCAKEMEACQGDDDCCTGMVCHDGHCGPLHCLDVGAPVSAINQCSDCCTDNCDLGAKACGALEHWSCDPAHRCADRNYCDNNGTCHNCDQPQKIYACTSDDQCCTRKCEQGVCCGGESTTPGGTPSACGDGVCCGGMECCSATVPPYCTQQLHASCSSVADCCPPAACIGGTCEIGPQH